MRKSFGTFTTLESEKDFTRYVFWFFVEKEAREVIEDLSREPFQMYCKALELNGESFHHKSFGYPASEVFFINPESVKDFHNALAVWQRKYNLCFTDEKLNHSKNKQTDWIPAKACKFLWHWSEFPKDFESLFLSNSGSAMGFIDNSFPKGFDEFRAHFETPEIYAERMAEKAQSKINSDEMLSNLPKPDQRRFIESAKKKALKHAKDFQKSKVIEHSHLSPAKDLPSFEKHFVWLIKTYILGKRFIDISRESQNEIDVAGISRNVKNLANILGLPKPSHLKQGNPNLTCKP